MSNILQQAIAFHRNGQWQQAEPLYRSVLASNPLHPDALYNYAILQLNRGLTEDGLILLTRASEVCPNEGIYSILGDIMFSAPDYSRALFYYDLALSLNPHSMLALNKSGVALERLGQTNEAIERFKNALAIQHENPAILNNMAGLLLRNGRFEESVACYRRALAVEPADTDCMCNLMMALNCTGEIDEAVRLGRHITKLKPEDPRYRLTFAGSLLAAGNFDEGFREYGSRWYVKDMEGSARNFIQPQWQGQDLEGKTLLIHGEQGYGDTLQFLRYARLAVDRGINVVLEVQPLLVRLAQSIKGIRQVVARGHLLPAFDCHCPVMDLPIAFHTKVDTVPSFTPYLFADASDVNIWRRRLSRTPHHKKIGLVWSGNPRLAFFHISAIDKRRSVPFHFLSPLLGLDGAKFYSLQKDWPATDFPPSLIDRMGECNDFADTAALISQLDLVISVDTSVAHLAGALGKKVWMLDRFDTCWRWRSQHDQKPWYPTMQIFRQTRSGDWAGVIDRVVEALIEFLDAP